MFNAANFHNIFLANLIIFMIPYNLSWEKSDTVLKHIMST